MCNANDTIITKVQELMEVRKMILQPFITADEARTSRGGSGLGLAISSKVISLMGGTLRVVDADGEYIKAFEIQGLPIHRAN